MTGELPSDYTIEDGYKQDNGIEYCPHCGIEYHGNGGYIEDVYDQNGRHYEYYLDTSPGDGPFFCPDCWEELDANRRANENHGLTDYQ